MKKATVPAGTKIRRKDMRFKVSLVILTGTLLFSVLLLLISLNRADGVNAGITSNVPFQKTDDKVIQKTAPAGLFTFKGGGGEDFQLSIPAGWKGWVYRTGAVKSLVDDSLSDEYVKIYLPNDAAKGTGSPDLDSRYKDVITIMSFSVGEWKKLDKKCRNDDEEACEDMGAKLADTACRSNSSEDTEDIDCVYSYTRRKDCSGLLAARCGEIDKIMEGFKLIQ